MRNAEKNYVVIVTRANGSEEIETNLYVDTLKQALDMKRTALRFDNTTSADIAIMVKI